MHAYEEIAEELAAEIEAGDWPAGTTLPTIPALMERFGVSRITVRGGLDELMTRGLVYTGYVSGIRGTIVRGTGRTDHFATDAIAGGRPRSNEDAFVENARRVGRTPGKRFEMRIAAPPAAIATRLGINVDDLAVIRVTYQLLDNEPWARERSYYARDLAEEVGLDVPHDIPQGTIRALAEAGYQELAYCDEVTDETASTDDARDLAVPVGSPLLVQTRTAAAASRVTRVTEYHRLGRRNRIVFELGDPDALSIIRAARDGAAA